MVWQVIICSLAGGVFAVTGGVVLTMLKKAKTISSYLTAFAAGVLLAAAFLDLLPEALEGGAGNEVFIFVLIGLIAFFILEGFLRWFHGHNHNNEPERDGAKPIVPMIIIGDTIHNFMDGLAIAAGFLISPANGIIVTLAVAAHEIPQEISDFAILLNSGLSRKKVIAINILSASVSTFSAVIFFVIGAASDISLTPLIGITAGFFIYVATTDIIPAILQERTHKNVAKKSALLILGIVVIFFTTTYLHKLIDHHDGHDHYDSSTHLSDD